MSKFDDPNYFSILTKSLKKGVKIPFDCFVYLPANGKVVIFVNNGMELTEKKAAKLEKFRKQELYIKIADKEAYYNFLNDFFQTDEGKVELKNMIDEAGGVDQLRELDGIPTAKEFDLSALSEFLTDDEDDTEVKGGGEEDEGAVAVTGGEEDEGKIEVTGDVSEEESETEVKGGNEEDDGTVAVQDNTPTPNVGSVQMSIDEDEDPLVQALKSQVNKLSEKMQFRSAFNQDELTMIKSVTDKVKKEVLMIQQNAESSGVEKNTVRRVTSLIDAEIKKIGGLSSDKNDNIKSVIDDIVMRISAEKEVLEDILVSEDDNPSANKEEFTLKVKDKFGTVGDVMSDLQMKIGEDGGKTISDSLSEMIKEAEDVTGQKVQVAWENSTDALKLKEISEDIKLEAAIKRELHEKMEESRELITTIVDRWADFQMGIRAKVDEKDKLNAKQLNAYLEELVQRNNLLDDQFEKALGVAKKIHDAAGIKEEDINSIDVASAQAGGDQNGAGDDGSARKDEIAEERAEAAKNKAIEKERKESQGEITALREENKILKVQLEDAKALIDSNDKKIKELDSVIGQNTLFSKSQTQELDELKKKVQLYENRVEELDGKDSRYQEAIAESEKAQAKMKVEVEKKDAIIKELSLEKDQAQREVKVLREKFTSNKSDNAAVVEMQKSFEHMLKEKELQIESQQKNAMKMLNEVTAKKKEVATLTEQVKSQQQKTKTVAEKYEVIRLDFTAIKKERDSLNVKVKVATTTLDKTRDSFGKLEKVNEELRKDRLIYMNKTNEAVKNLKEMVNRAVTLNNTVQAEMQKSKALAEQAESIKDRERDTLAKFSQTANKLKDLQDEYNRLRVSHDRLQAKAESGGGQDPQLQKKFDNMKTQNRELATQLVQEQKKATDAAKEIRSLELQIERLGGKKNAS